MSDIAGLTAVGTPEAPSTPVLSAAIEVKSESPTKGPKKIAETIDVVGTTQLTPNVSREPFKMVFCSVCPSRSGAIFCGKNCWAVKIVFVSEKEASRCPGTDQHPKEAEEVVNLVFQFCCSFC